ncbi:transposase [Saccharobesus litoralis]|uniref:Transposase n=2 Tax=Saccharobesus litoralis TaxID=2172099 RepID=A0A2S0VXS1_9ALTE|nr:transposase [Saccharobesus litoralis]
MPNYRRLYKQGGIYFFTINLLERGDNDLLVRNIDLLRESVKSVKARYPFNIHAWVVLPDHLHCVIELPAGDDNFSLRWRQIKSYFSRNLPANERLSATRQKRYERGIWQRRFWEHLIRDERDYWHRINYVHYNPMKHGLVKRVADWPYSTFHLFVKKKIYDIHWCG